MRRKERPVIGITTPAEVDDFFRHREAMRHHRIKYGINGTSAHVTPETKPEVVNRFIPLDYVPKPLEYPTAEAIARTQAVQKYISELHPYIRELLKTFTESQIFEELTSEDFYRRQVRRGEDPTSVAVGAVWEHLALRHLPSTLAPYEVSLSEQALNDLYDMLISRKRLPVGVRRPDAITMLVTPQGTIVHRVVESTMANIGRYQKKQAQRNYYLEGNVIRDVYAAQDEVTQSAIVRQIQQTYPEITTPLIAIPELTSVDYIVPFGYPAPIPANRGRTHFLPVQPVSIGDLTRIIVPQHIQQAYQGRVSGSF